MANPGHFYWNELMTKKTDAAKKFYGATLGWTFDSMAMPDGTYWVAKMGDKPVGGIFTMTGPMFDNVPEHWFCYIEVDDVDARIKKLTAAGGKIIRPPFDVPNVAKLAIVQDANGAMFGLSKPAANT